MRITVLLLVVVLAVATVSAQRAQRGRIVFSSSSSRSRPSSSRSFRPSSRTTSSGQLSFNPPQFSSFGGGRGIAGFGAPRITNPRSLCPGCIGPGINSVFAEPINPISLRCYQNLAARLPGSKVHVGIEEDIYIIDQNGFPRDTVYDGFGRNLFEDCEL